jgi:hypothetical protein
MITKLVHISKIYVTIAMAATLLSWMLWLQGCSAPAPKESKEVSFASGRTSEGKITEAQLQDSLFRFANRFSSNAQDALKPLEESQDPVIRTQALMRRLLYNSAALDITLGVSPQTNLLDMVAFIELSRSVWKQYWVPKVFKSEGDPMRRAFETASHEIWGIASEVMSEDQRKLLTQLIQKWREKNPDQIAVENVRFSEFAKETGAQAQAMQSDVGGLLAGISRATQTGDRALLFSERALFYAQRAPFLWRLQAQAGTREVLSEAMTTLGSLNGLLEQEPRARALMKDLTATFAAINQTLETAAAHPEALQYSSTTLSRITEVLREMDRTLSNAQSRPGPSQFAAAVQSVDFGANRFLWKTFVLGAVLIFLFGIVSLGSRLAYFWITNRSMRRKSARPSAERRHKAA